MSTPMQTWIERVLGPNVAESPVRQVQLTTEGIVWQTWDAPFIAEQFVSEAETMLAQVAEEMPNAKKVSCTFIASGVDGGVRGTHLQSVLGKNKNAGELSLGATGQASKSFAEAMETLVRVVNVVLKSAETQVTSLTRTCESQSTQLHEMHEYNRIRAELELVNGTNEKPDLTAQLGQQLTEAAPVLIEALKLSLAEKSKNLASSAASASSAVTPTNGAH